MKAVFSLVGMVILIAVVIWVNSSHAAIAPESIVAIWLFDDPDDVIIDSSGNEHDATVVGNPEWVDGRYGQAIQLDGTAYADVAQDHAEAFSLLTYTLTAWIGEKEIGGHQFVFHKSTGNTDRNYIMNIQLDTGFFVSGFCTANDGAWRSVVSTTNVADGQWHHLAGTYDGEAFKVYVDGVLEKTTVLVGGPALNDAPPRIGRGANQAQPFTGIIDEILVANVALDQDDIQSIMNRGLEEATGMNAVSAAGKLASTWARIRVGE